MAGWHPRRSWKELSNDLTTAHMVTGSAENAFNPQYSILKIEEYPKRREKERYKKGVPLRGLPSVPARAETKRSTVLQRERRKKEKRGVRKGKRGKRGVGMNSFQPVRAPGDLHGTVQERSRCEDGSRGTGGPQRTPPGGKAVYNKITLEIDRWEPKGERGVEGKSRAIKQSPARLETEAQIDAAPYP